MENFLLIVAALFLVALNGFFVAAEFGLVKLRQTRIRAIVHEQLDAYLSACQLGITLASLGLSWIGEPAFASLLEPLFHLLGVASPEIIQGVSFILAFFLISFLHIVVGELAPKSMAIRSPERIGLWCAPPLYVFYWMMFPAIWLLNRSANWLLRVTRLGRAVAHDAHYSSDELKLILRSGTRHAKGMQGSGTGFTQLEWNLLAHSLDFGEQSLTQESGTGSISGSSYGSKTGQFFLDLIASNTYEAKS